MIVTGSPHGLHFLFFLFFLKKNSLSANKNPTKQLLQRDPVPAQGAQWRDLYCQGLQCGRSVNYSNKDFKKKKKKLGAETNTFPSLFQRSHGHWEKAEQAKGTGCTSLCVFFTKSFRQKRWGSCRFLSCYNQPLHVSYGTAFMAQSLHVMKLSIKLEVVGK